jgi:hypothetical protein
MLVLPSWLMQFQMRWVRHYYRFAQQTPENLAKEIARCREMTDKPLVSI